MNWSSSLSCTVLFIHKDSWNAFRYYTVQKAFYANLQANVTELHFQWRGGTLLLWAGSSPRRQVVSCKSCRPWWQRAVAHNPITAQTHAVWADRLDVSWLICTLKSEIERMRQMNFYSGVERKDCGRSWHECVFVQVQTRNSDFSACTYEPVTSRTVFNDTFAEDIVSLPSV